MDPVSRSLKRGALRPRTADRPFRTSASTVTISTPLAKRCGASWRTSDTRAASTSARVIGSPSGATPRAAMSSATRRHWAVAQPPIGALRGQPGHERRRRLRESSRLVVEIAQTHRGRLPAKDLERLWCTTWRRDRCARAPFPPPPRTSPPGSAGHRPARDRGRRRGARSPVHSGPGGTTPSRAARAPRRDPAPRRRRHSGT